MRGAGGAGGREPGGGRGVGEPAGREPGGTEAVDPTVWRVVGDPLVAGTADGPLRGESVAVKDLFAVAGHRVGAGVPAFLAQQGPAPAHADAVRLLLDAGADVRGIARTDELAYSLAGRNPHHGTPPNPAVPDGLPGGSSSGPAAAVALGEATIGLGTDTGGSVRVPASYQGLWGLRTTHGSVPAAGLVPLAPAFDTVGWLTRDARTLAAAADASLGVGGGCGARDDAVGDDGVADDRVADDGVRGDGVRVGGVRGDGGPVPGRPVRGFAVAPGLLAEAEPGVRAAFDHALSCLAAAGLLEDLAVVGLPVADDLLGVFRAVQAAQAWRTHGDWLTRNPDALGADVAARFRWASTITPPAPGTAVAAARRVEAVLGDRVLLLPSASSAAPPRAGGGADDERVRTATMRLTCVAGLTGRPALSVPVLGVERSGSWALAPVGLCLVGPRGSDRALVGLGARWAEELGTVGPPAAKRS
ncbi:hypothetical protein Q760_17120 [Cellulomonas cellasea DSM 20118]|uniref:Amidase domain-containing protein n=1 Tax=Cellulomonas cellasea DSM 20118 TaxID=1408250 RepID=A0A0A0B7T7_9CELL|nr:hypothetical protein Q760_17120 [Cellulomonas cellasea DSM 20118]